MPIGAGAQVTARRGYWHAVEPSLVRAELANRAPRSQSPTRFHAELRTPDRGPARETRRAFGPETWRRHPVSVPPPALLETGMMTITLITGANKGLGYETARRLIDLGHTVLAGARDPQRGTKAARELGATFIHIDPTDDDSVEAAAARVRNEYGHLDVLINNAGTAAPRLGAEELTADAAMEGFAINVFGPIRVTHAFLPLLRAAEHPRIVNVSSGAGSFQRILGPGTVENAVTLPVYPATKAALTMLTVQYARALDGILVNAADPGFTGTDFNDHRGTQTVTEGTDAIVHLATLPPDGPTGTFQDRHGPVPW
jgi:NAD(P)-dependent dehydrogenase (short-subunit alcohol dehydrogenase family)